MRSEDTLELTHIHYETLIYTDFGSEKYSNFACADIKVFSPVFFLYLVSWVPQNNSLKS